MSQIVAGGILAALFGRCPKCGERHHQDYAHCDGLRVSTFDRDARRREKELLEDPYLPPMRFLEK